MAVATEPGWDVDFPTLAHLHDKWVPAHCSIPQGFDAGQPFVMSAWQFWCQANHYRVKKSAKIRRDGQPLLNEAFQYRRSLIVGPQKLGKGPWAAAGLLCIEAVGPSLFAGWAEAGDMYLCSDYGCGCGFEYEYEPGDPMGVPHPTPKIEMLAATEDQVANTYDPLVTMIENGPLQEQMLVREGFIRLPTKGSKCMITAVTSSNRARLGAPITFAMQDENGTYTESNKLSKTARTQRRGLAGMRGRSAATTNMWDPAEDSDAQQTWESTVKDVFKFYEPPPAHLKWDNKRDRRKIFQHVYAHAPWISIDSIEADAADLSEKRPDEAKRFFGNMAASASGTWLEDGLWESAYAGAE